MGQDQQNVLTMQHAHEHLRDINNIEVLQWADKLSQTINTKSMQLCIRCTSSNAKQKNVPVHEEHEEDEK